MLFQFNGSLQIIIVPVATILQRIWRQCRNANKYNFCYQVISSVSRCDYVFSCQYNIIL